MPNKPKRPCRYQGCSKLCDKTYCNEHKKLTDHQYNRYSRSPNTNKMYGRSWKRVRDKYVQQNPLCECCFAEGRVTPVDEVHHKIPLNQGGTHDKSNLLSVCRSCHNKIHHRIGDRQSRN